MCFGTSRCAGKHRTARTHPHTPPPHPAPTAGPHSRLQPPPSNRQCTPSAQSPPTDPHLRVARVPVHKEVPVRRVCEVAGAGVQQRAGPGGGKVGGGAGAQRGLVGGVGGAPHAVHGAGAAQLLAQVAVQADLEACWAGGDGREWRGRGGCGCGGGGGLRSCGVVGAPRLGWGGWGGCGAAMRFRKVAAGGAQREEASPGPLSYPSAAGVPSLQHAVWDACTAGQRTYLAGRRARGSRSMRHRPGTPRSQTPGSAQARSAAAQTLQRTDDETTCTRTGTGRGGTGHMHG